MFYIVCRYNTRRRGGPTRATSTPSSDVAKVENTSTEDSSEPAAVSEPSVVTPRTPGRYSQHYSFYLNCVLSILSDKACFIHLRFAYFHIHIGFIHRNIFSLHNTSSRSLTFFQRPRKRKLKLLNYKKFIHSAS
jgi:hypothetical protein